MELFLDTADAEIIRELTQTCLIHGVTTNPSILRKQFPDIANTKDDYYEISRQYYINVMQAYIANMELNADHNEEGMTKFINEPLDNPSMKQMKLRLEKSASIKHIPQPIINLEIFSYGNTDSVDFIRDQIIRLCSLINETQFKNNDIRHRLGIKIPLNQNALTACTQLKNAVRSFFPAIDIFFNATLCFSFRQAIMAAKAGADYVSVFAGRLDDNNIDSTAEIDKIIKCYKHYNFETKVLIASVRNINHIERAFLSGAHAATMPVNIFNELCANQLTNAGLEKFCNDWQSN